LAGAVFGKNGSFRLGRFVPFYSRRAAGGGHWLDWNGPVPRGGGGISRLKKRPRFGPEGNFVSTAAERFGEGDVMFSGRIAIVAPGGGRSRLAGPLLVISIGVF